MRWSPSRGALRLLYTHRTPSRRVPLGRRPPAAAAASPPLTRACRLISAYSEAHSGRPLGRAPRVARAHQAALARPSAAQAPSRVPLGHRYRRAAVCGARCKPEAAARARRSTRPRRASSRRAVHTGRLREACRGRGGCLLHLHAQIDQRLGRQPLGLNLLRFCSSRIDCLALRAPPLLSLRASNHIKESNRELLAYPARSDTLRCRSGRSLPPFRPHSVTRDL